MVSPSMSRRSANSLWLVLIALVLGLVLGAGAVSMTWFVSRHAATASAFPTTNASLDATTACADLARVPGPSGPSFTVLAVQGAPDALVRLAGAATLASAAAAEDTHYQQLADAMNRADRLVEAWHDESSGPQALDALTAAQAASLHL